MDVIAWRNQDVEIARAERTTLHELESAIRFRVDLLVLRPAVEADEPPSQVVVDRRLRAGRNYEREERQRAVLCEVEEPLPDAAAHAALRGGGLVVGEEP